MTEFMTDNEDIIFFSRGECNKIARTRQSGLALSSHKLRLPRCWLVPTSILSLGISLTLDNNINFSTIAILSQYQLYHINP